MTDSTTPGKPSVINLEAQGQIRAYVRHVVTSTMMAKSTRDMQRMPGPSDLANECDRCVALSIGRAAGLVPHSNRQFFSLKAWLGTAVHEKLEREVPRYFPRAITESKVPVHSIPTFGDIDGHIDLRLEDVEYAASDTCAVWADYKTKDLVMIRRYKTDGVPVSHVGQMMLYGYGLRRAGLRADVACLVYIPRDSNNVKDVWEASCEYREDIALGLLKRAEDLLQRVRLEGVYTIPSDEGCFVCTVQHQFSR